MFHGGHLWETKLRVPILLRGPGLQPRAVDETATLIDLTPTFAELARVPADPRWTGRSLLHLDGDRPAFAFQLTKKSREVALLQRGHKVIAAPEPRALASGACEEAYDLDADPGEETNVAQSAAWPAELARELAKSVLAALVPLGPAEKARPSD